MSDKRKRPFPCPYCKGKGSWDVFCLDSGECAQEHCAVCDNGFIEVGGAQHQQLVANRISLQSFHLLPWKADKNTTWRLRRDIGNQVQAHAEAIASLAGNPDNWTTDDYCLQCDTLLPPPDADHADWFAREWGYCSRTCAALARPDVFRDRDKGVAMEAER